MGCNPNSIDFVNVQIFIFDDHDVFHSKREKSTTVGENGIIQS